MTKLQKHENTDGISDISDYVNSILDVYLGGLTVPATSVATKSNLCTNQSIFNKLV